jgi:hypothetical protein
MKSTLIIEKESADSYFPGYEITGFFKGEGDDDLHVNLGFTQEESDEEKHIILECEERSIDAVYNRVCDSMINHPHVIDLRGLTVKIVVL